MTEPTKIPREENVGMRIGTGKVHEHAVPSIICVWAYKVAKDTAKIKPVINITTIANFLYMFIVSLFATNI